MPICHDRQFIFCHIPRCGGSALQVGFGFEQKPAALIGVSNVGQQVLTLHHLTTVDMLRYGLVDHGTLKTYFKFTVIRDPFERMVSDYFWQKQHDSHDEFGDMSFKTYLEFARTVIRDERYFEKKHYDHFRPMADYCLRDGALLMNEILLLEDIDRELLGIRNRVGPVSVARLNHSLRTQELRTSENMDAVNRYYECDRVLYDNIARLREAL